MTTYLGNAFSLGMLDVDRVELDVRRCSPADVPASAESCVGHADTAELLSAILGRDVPMRRVSTSLLQGDVIYVAQYNGPRLPEGATSLPEGATLRWFRVIVQAPATCACGEQGTVVCSRSCAGRVAW